MPASGPCIVAGNAWCLHDDLEAARKLVGDVPVLGVNAAAREIKADYLYSQHPDRLNSHGWIRNQKRLFGDGFTVHGSAYREGMPWVDYWWEDARGGGSSAWGGRKVAWLIGHDPVTLIGCPLVAGNYAGQKPGLLMTSQSVIEGYRAQIIAEPWWHDGVFSMSGWTREMFGAPC